MAESESKSKIRDPKSKIDLVCFDLGRVLIRICENWPHACRIAGVPEPGYPLEPAVRARFLEAIGDYESGRLDVGSFARLTSPHLNLSVDQMRAASAAYVIEPFAGGPELLDALHACGLKTACLSNTIDVHWERVMNESGPFRPLMSRFGHAFASHVVGIRKPDPKIYEHVERETGVAGRNILFFDDMIENIEAATHRGWTAEHIARDRDPIPQLREHLLRLKIL